MTKPAGVSPFSGARRFSFVADGPSEAKPLQFWSTQKDATGLALPRGAAAVI